MHRITNPTQTKKRPRRRRGVLTLELFLAAPIVGLLACGVLQFALLLTASSAVSAAAAAGQREATLAGATTADVEAAVARSLKGWRFGAQATVRAVVYDETGASWPLEHARSGDVVQVAVTAPAAAAAPDLLRVIGISLADQQLRSGFVGRIP